MILTRTPMRLSLFGGGTDLPAYYRLSPGRVLGGAIDRYLHVTLSPRFDGKTRVSYSQTELVADPRDLQHDLARAVLVKAKVSGVDVAFFSDAPPDGSGLGSSSALTVGLIHAIYALQGVQCEPYELAEEAAKIEIKQLQKPIGKQDQHHCARGGLHEFTFDHFGAVGAYRCDESATASLERCLLLFYTGQQRGSDAILTEQGENIEHSNEARMTLFRMAELARRAGYEVARGMGHLVGELLDESWALKKTLATGIASEQIDAWYAQAKKAGAVGGKVLGAGGGGFMVFHAPPERHAAIIAALANLRHVPFRFDREGTKVVYSAKSPLREG